jgi:hypothetical protein
MRETFDKLDPQDKADKEISNGMISMLRKQGVSVIMVRAILGCGSSRVQRIDKRIANPDLVRQAFVPNHTATPEDIS